MTCRDGSAVSSAWKLVRNWTEAAWAGWASARKMDWSEDVEFEHRWMVAMKGLTVTNFLMREDACASANISASCEEAFRLSLTDIANTIFPR